jgi:hypothetical protein
MRVSTLMENYAQALTSKQTDSAHTDEDNAGQGDKVLQGLTTESETAGILMEENVAELRIKKSCTAEAEMVLNEVFALLEMGVKNGGSEAPVTYAHGRTERAGVYNTECDECDEALGAGLKSACGALDDLDASMHASVAAMERILLKERQKVSDMREKMTRCRVFVHICVCMHACMYASVAAMGRKLPKENGLDMRED